MDASAPSRTRRIDATRMQAWRAFLEAHAAVTDVLAAELRAREGLPLTWYDVLVQLAEAPERRLRMQELATAVLLSKSGLTRLIQRMEHEGMVARAACPDDRRGTFATLTERGLETLRRTAPTHLAGIDEHFTSRLSDREAVVLAQSLRRIADAARHTDGPA